MWTRTHPLIHRLAEIAAAGEIGEIRHVAAEFGFAFRGPDSHRLLDPDQAGGAILDAGVYPAHAVNLFLGEPAELSAYGHHARTGVDVHTAAVLRYPATDRRGPATASMLCSIRVPAAQPARGLRHRRPDHDRRFLPARRAGAGVPRRRRAGGARGELARPGLHLRGRGGDALPAVRRAGVADGSVGRHPRGGAYPAGLAGRRSRWRPAQERRHGEADRGRPAVRLGIADRHPGAPRRRADR